MKISLSYCEPSTGNCQKVEGAKLSEKDGKLVFTGVDNVNGVELGVTITDYTSTESQSSHSASGEMNEVDYVHLSQIWGTAFTSIVFFYFAGRIAGTVLEFIKREAFH